MWTAGLIALGTAGRNRIVSLADPTGITTPFHSGLANFLIAPAARWDSVWYLKIAHDGYYSQQSSGMFPLYPLLIRIGSVVLRSELIVGVAISLASFVAALYLLDRLIRLDFDQQIARTALLLIIFFPVALFFSAVYTESLYLLVSVAAIYAARQDRWGWAGVLGALASATRSEGILILAPLLFIYLYGPRARAQRAVVTAWWMPRYRVTPALGWLALVPAGVGSYLAYLGVVHGQPLATFHAQEVYWGHHFAGPFGGVIQTIGRVPGDVSGLIAGKARLAAAGDPLTWNAHDLINLGFFALAVIGLIGAWPRVPVAYLIYTVLLLAIATSFPTPREPLQSISRYMMVMFPLFIGWALLLRRRPWLTPAILGISATLLAVFSALWATWGWVA